MVQNPSHSALAIEGVSKVFTSGTNALAPIDLAIDDGSFVAIVGPSGCGKSTLLRIMAGLSDPSSGTILRGFDDTETELSVSFVFQDPTLMPWATVKENVALPLKLKPQTQLSSNIDEVLTWVGLERFESAYPRALSGGMRMRASIARALLTRPSLLLLDEPFAALDEFTRAQLNEDLLRLWEEQKWTGVFVTHSIREAVFLSERVIVLSPRPGRILADVAIPFPHPRTTELRDDHAFSDLCAEISHSLASALTENNS